MYIGGGGYRHPILIIAPFGTWFRYHHSIYHCQFIQTRLLQWIISKNFFLALSNNKCTPLGSKMVTPAHWKLMSLSKTNSYKYKHLIFWSKLVSYLRHRDRFTIFFAKHFHNFVLIDGAKLILQFLCGFSYNSVCIKIRWSGHLERPMYLVLNYFRESV